MRDAPFVLEALPCWGKRNVISHHFTELVLEIVEMGML